MDEKEAEAHPLMGAIFLVINASGLEYYGALNNHKHLMTSVYGTRKLQCPR